MGRHCVSSVLLGRSRPAAAGPRAPCAPLGCTNLLLPAQCASRALAAPSLQLAVPHSARTAQLGLTSLSSNGPLASPAPLGSSSLPRLPHSAPRARLAPFRMSVDPQRAKPASPVPSSRLPRRLRAASALQGRTSPTLQPRSASCAALRGTRQAQVCPCCQTARCAHRASTKPGLGPSRPRLAWIASLGLLWPSTGPTNAPTVPATVTQRLLRQLASATRVTQGC